MLQWEKGFLKIRWLHIFSLQYKVGPVPSLNKNVALILLRTLTLLISYPLWKTLQVKVVGFFC